MRQKRRDALKGSAESHSLNVQAPARQGRRAAIMPMDTTLMSSRPSICTNAGSDIDDDVADEKRQSSGFLPGLDADDMMSFMEGLNTKTHQSHDDTYTRPNKGVLPGLSPDEMTSLMNKVRGAADDSEVESDTEDAPAVPSGLLPGFEQEVVMPLISKSNQNADDSVDTDNDD